MAFVQLGRRARTRSHSDAPSAFSRMTLSTDHREQRRDRAIPQAGLEAGAARTARPSASLVRMKHHRLQRLTFALLLPTAALSLHSTRPLACVPGQSISCTGPAGCSGGQSCNAAGDSARPRVVERRPEAHGLERALHTPRVRLGSPSASVAA